MLVGARILLNCNSYYQNSVGSSYSLELVLPSFRIFMNDISLSGSLILAKKTIKAQILGLREGKKLLGEEFKNHRKT
jgi:hypothetical protein